MASQIRLQFSEIDWGEDDAKKDEGLIDYFVKCPDFEKIMDGKKRYLIGRKGTGKSAVLQYIRKQSDSDATVFSRDLSLRDLPVNDFKSLGDRAFTNKSKFVSAWNFIMLNELSKLLIEDQSVSNTDKAPLERFQVDNFPRKGYSIAETIWVLKNKENKVKICCHVEAGQTKQTGTEQVQQLHFNEAANHLASMIATVKTENTFYLLIDELDEGYKVDDRSPNLLILALLRAAEDLYAQFKQSGLRVISLVALRSDIFDNLEDNDLNKLDDYVYRFNWMTDVTSPWSLKTIVENRIRATLAKKYRNAENTEVDLWELIADESKTRNSPKGLWQYLCILTFTRPRDIIKLMKCCSQQIGTQSKLNFGVVQKAEEQFSDWFYREFRDEVQSFLPCWKSVLNCLSEMAKGKDTVSALHENFLKKDEIVKWLEAEHKQASDITEILFNYSVIGCINRQGRWIFKYKDSSFEFMSTYPYYCIHYGFCKKLRINKNYQASVIQEAYKSYS